MSQINNTLPTVPMIKSDTIDIERAREFSINFVLIYLLSFFSCQLSINKKSKDKYIMCVSDEIIQSRNLTIKSVFFGRGFRIENPRKLFAKIKIAN